MKYRYGYASQAPQKRLTPKSKFLRDLERAQARAASDAAVRAAAASRVITIEFDAVDLLPKIVTRV